MDKELDEMFANFNINPEKKPSDSEGTNDAIDSMITIDDHVQKDVIVYNLDEEAVEHVNVDILMADVITMLNKHGFYTAFCCSGHYFEDGHKSWYIKFQQLPERKVVYLEALAKCVPKLIGVRIYEISCGGSYIQLENPNSDALARAGELVVMNESANNKDTKKITSDDVIVTYCPVFRYDYDRLLDRDKARLDVIDIAKSIMNLLDDDFFGA